jgi:hypothetical protein
MTVKERLHQLVEDLPENEAEQVLHFIEEKALQPKERRSVLGKYAHVSLSSEDFMRRKQEEIAHEEERSERRMRGGG